MCFPGIERLPVLFCVLLASCGALERYRVVYESYDVDYRKGVSFVEHRVPVPGRGGSLYVREYGAGADQRGPVLVLMHGITASLHVYDLLAPELARSFRVVSFDFLGWGQSSKPKATVYNFAGLRGDLVAVLDYFKAGSEAVLVAHDSAGFPAIDLMLDDPERVRSLVLLNAMYRGLESHELPEAIERFSTPGFSRDFGEFLARARTSSWQKGVADQLKKYFVRHDRRRRFVPVFGHQASEIRDAFFGLAAALQDERALLCDADRMRAAAPRVHWIFGVEDPYLDADVARRLHSVWPGSSIDFIEHAGHYVQLDRARELSECILRRLRSAENRKSVGGVRGGPR